MNSFPFSHTSHDFDEVVRRWKKLATEAGAQLETIETVDSLPVFSVETTSSDSDLPIYISAGVHGDECAPVWGLLDWAEANLKQLQNRSFCIFPCLNPHGFIENTRLDGKGIDLNRSFQDTTIPVISAWQKAVGDRKFSRCLNLHEDYDSRGIYLYEIANTPSLGRQIFDQCHAIIPCDPHENIDGQTFDNGLCSHEGNEIREVVEGHLEGGYPEAIYLFLYHSETSLTFETPSELDMASRIAAHRKAVETLVG